MSNINMSSVKLSAISNIVEKWKLQNKTLTSVIQCHVIINLSNTEGMNQDRNEDIWPNGKLPNVYHMQQAGRKRKWYLKWPLF